ncbi:MAG: 2-amino-4-hydroxy-6-hydroxymethyldihydropteridine diphosphokinase [Woeseiaceae bacterium]|jgi:2-amino-4-hydroxy-6-hydroxymethyldihydropteridine diphosphokinase
MAVIYLGIGSNLNPQENLRLALCELEKRFSLRKISPVYRNKALGFEGGDFLNAVVCVETELDPTAVCHELQIIHDIAGRKRDARKFSSRTLDIDLLLYDDLVTDDKNVSVPRSDVLEFSFVLRPLADIEPNLRHPVTGKTMARHWLDFDASSHPLQEEALSLQQA